MQRSTCFALMVWRSANDWKTGQSALLGLSAAARAQRTGGLAPLGAPRVG